MTTLSPADLDRLEATAKAATPGKWYTVDPIWLPRDSGTYVIAGHSDPHLGKMICDSPNIDEWDADEDGPDYSQSWADLEHIAAIANPETSLALIALARAALAAEAARCKWTENDGDDSFDAECGGKFTRDEHAPDKFCASCGKRIEVDKESD